MKYEFFDPGDETLIEVSELPVEGAIALSIKTTGYDAEEDEILEISVVDIEGAELFSKRVKPQNVESWEASDAAGGILPAMVENEPELYQFEEELSDIVEGASIVIGQHMPFIEAMMAQSWVTLPPFTGFDIIERFRLSHCTPDFRSEPAAVATLAGIAGYYGIDANAEGASTLTEARVVAEAYRALVREHAEEREGKGAAYWARRDEENREESEQKARVEAAIAKREKNFDRMNAMMWVVGAIIFTSIVIQLFQRGGDASLMVVFAACAAFCLARGVMSFRR